jgi:hypothetical protein
LHCRNVKCRRCVFSFRPSLTALLRAVVGALATGIIAVAREIGWLHFDVHAGMDAFGVTAFAREHLIAFHKSLGSRLIRIATRSSSFLCRLVPRMVLSHSAMPPTKVVGLRYSSSGCLGGLGRSFLSHYHTEKFQVDTKRLTMSVLLGSILLRPFDRSLRQS